MNLLKTKTFWAGCVAIITAVGSFFTGEMAFADMVQTVSTGLIGIFLRQGLVTTSGNRDD
jgi:hypothetical protein